MKKYFIIWFIIILCTINIVNTTIDRKRNYVKLIDVYNAYNKYWKNQKGLFIDARTRELYDKKHISNSINLFYGYRSRWNDTELFHLDKKHPIIVYCDGTNCTLSELMVKFLQKQKFKNVYKMEEGLDGWEYYNLPIDISSLTN